MYMELEHIQLTNTTEIPKYRIQIIRLRKNARKVNEESSDKKEH